MRAGFPSVMSSALPTREDFTPTDITTVSGWYDATDFTTITKNVSERVQTWADKSGGGNSLTTSSSAVRPTLQSNEQNSLPTINFDGNHEMVIPSGLFTIPNGANTIFIVSQRASESGSLETVINMSDAAAADYFVTYSASTGVISFKSRDGAAGSVSNTGNTLTNYNIIRGRRSGTTQALAVNGGTETTNTSGVDSAGIDSGDVGANNGANFRLTGNIGEIIIYSASLSAADILSVETYLSNKWGLTLA